jgi:hypothetical protein
MARIVSATLGRREKIRPFPGLPGCISPRNTMDIERINAIGATLADLKARTDALRGYL